jgi:hypothetical protein
MPAKLQEAKIYIENLMRQWFEKMLPGYFLRIRYINSKTTIADSDYINRPARVITIRVSVPYLIANIHNYKSDVFRKLVIHELAHIPDIQEFRYSIRHKIETPLVKRVKPLADKLDAIERILELKPDKPIEQNLLKIRDELDRKYQRLWHSYGPYRERVKQYGGSERIADDYKMYLTAYKGTKKSLVDPDIHNYVLVSCPKCRDIQIHAKEEKHICKKCKIPMKTRKLKPEEVIRFYKIQPHVTETEGMQILRKAYPRF